MTTNWSFMASTAASRNLHCITQKHKNCEIITEELQGENVATSNALASPPGLCHALLKQQQGQQGQLPGQQELPVPSAAQGHH